MTYLKNGKEKRIHWHFEDIKAIILIMIVKFEMKTKSQTKKRIRQT